MQSITLEVLELSSITTWKVHRSACLEVKNIMDKIAEIFTALESARPRCKSGLQLLCSLHNYMHKCKFLLRHCSESSKLYLAISGEGIILRCERYQNCFESYLSSLQNMVEPTLAAQISQIVVYIKSVAFTLDSSEDEAGKVLLSLLHRDIAASKSDNLEEMKAFKLVAFRLQITSPLALMIEKRSIRKLLIKTSDSDPAKRKILNYLLYLARKYGKLIKPQETLNKKNQDPQGDDDDDMDVFDSHEPPMNFKNRRLSTLSSSSSVPSFSSSLGNLNLQVDHVSFRSSDTNSVECVSDFEIQENSDERFDCVQKKDNGTNLFILVKLSVLPWQSRRKVVEDVKEQLKYEQEEGSHGFISTTYIKPVCKFLKEAHRLNDSGAKKNGAELLLMFLKECRSGMPPLPKDAIYDLSQFMDSEITEEALQILEILSFQHHYNSEIVASGILSFLQELINNPKKSKHHNVALRVLCNLSGHNDIGHHLVYLGFIDQLVPFLDEVLLAGHCIKIFRNLCAIDEAAAHFVENERCVESIGELLEVGKEEEQENALDILISLYYQREELHDMLMQDGIISLLALISKNGTSQGKLIASELLRLLDNVPGDNSLAYSFSDTSQSTNGNLKQVIEASQTKNGNPKPKSSCSKSEGLFGRLKAKFRKSVR